MSAVRVGTSGFAYDAWAGSFYPDDLARARRLEYYARALSTVEINNTFYRLPRRAMLEGWCEQTPAGFRFAIKASRRITHKKPLAGDGDALAYFLETVTALGDRLGPLLFQLPPWLRYQPEDFERLAGGLRDFEGEVAIEPRHDSWHAPEAAERIEQSGYAVVVTETDDSPVGEAAAQGAKYVRLRKSDYSAAELKQWAQRLSDSSGAYVYFKHEASAPAWARELQSYLQ